MPPQPQTAPKQGWRFGPLAALSAGALALLAVCAGAYLLHMHWQAQEERALFFAEALREHNVVETVSVRGSSYEVNRGKVSRDGIAVEGREALPALRLAYALSSVRRMPVFGLEGTDPSMLARAADELSAAQAAIGDLMAAEYPEWEQAAREGLFPVRFLRSIAELESARQAFLASATFENYERYTELLATVFLAHSEGVARYEAIGERLVAQYGEQSVPVPGFNSWRNVIASLPPDAEDLKRRVASPRRECIEGDIDSCAPIRDIRLLEALQLSEGVPAEVDLQQVTQVREMFFAATGRPSDSLVYELSESACAPLRDEPYLFTWRVDQAPSGLSSRALVYVQDLFLTKASAIPESSPVREYLDAEGVSLLPIWISTHYACRSIASDIARASFMDAAAQAARTAPFSDYVSEEEKSALQALEAALMDDALLREIDALNYLHAAHAALSDNAGAPKDVLDSLASLGLMSWARTGSFHDYAGQIATVFLRNLAIRESSPPLVLGVFEPPFLFTFKSGSAWLLLRHSPTATGEVQTEGPTALSVPTPIPPPRESYILFSELPAEGYTVQSLVDDLGFLFSRTSQVPAVQEATTPPTI